MERMTVSDARQEVDKWLEQGQYLMGLLPGLLDENDRLRTDKETAVKDAERLKDEVSDLRKENQSLRDENAEVGETVGRLMNDILQLTNEVVQRLRPAQRRAPFDRDDHAKSPWARA